MPVSNFQTKFFFRLFYCSKCGDEINNIDGSIKLTHDNKILCNLCFWNKENIVRGDT